MKNEYEIRGDVTAIFINSPKYGRMETLIATSDLPRVQEFTGYWYPNWHKGTQSFYVYGKVRVPDGRYSRVALHRWVMNVSDPRQVIDHILHDTLDNCNWALRITSQAENAQNCRVNKRNKSGVSGVAWQPLRGKWKAHIRVNRVLIHLGYFEDFSSAKAARAKAEEEYYPYKQKLIGA